MSAQTRESLAKSLIALGTAANQRLKAELESDSDNKTRSKIVNALGKFLIIGIQIETTPLDHKFDDLIDVLTTNHAQQSQDPFEPDYSVLALKRVALQLRLDNGESMDAKVSVLSRDPACDSLEHELFITESKLNSKPNLRDLMQLAHPSEIEWCPDETTSDSGLHSVVTELWTLVIDDKAKCRCQRAENEPYHLQRPLLSLSPSRDESGNFTFDILFKTACTSTTAGSSLNCLHESSVTIRSEPMNRPISNGLSRGKLCNKLASTHGKRLPLDIHMDTELKYSATMTAGLPEDMVRFCRAENAISLDDDTRFENLDFFEKIKIAADLSSSFYHFYGTRWMSYPWRSGQLKKVETPDSSAGYPSDLVSVLLSYQHEGNHSPNDWALAPEQYRRLLGRGWPQLFGFGLILLELMCDSDIRNLSRKILEKNNLWDRYRAARELLMAVENDLHPLVADCLDNIFENTLFQDAVDDHALEERRCIISEKVTTPMKALVKETRNIKALQHIRPPSSAGSDEVPRTSLRFGYFLESVLRHRTKGESSRSIGWVQRFVSINERILQKLHTAVPVATQAGVDTHWKPSRRIRIAILDSGYDPNSKFFDFQEECKNHGIKDRIKWKDFIGNSPPEDRHEDRHGTKLLCLMLMMLPMADIFVGRVALDKSYTESTKFVEPLVKAIDFATKIWGVDVVTISLGLDVRSEPEIEGAIKRACEYRGDRILFFAAAGNKGRGENERHPAHYADHVIGVRGTYENGTINPAYDPSVRRGPGDQDPRFATLGTAVPYGELSADNNNTLHVSGTSIAAPILAATAVTFLQFASFAAWYQPRREKQLRLLFEKKGMVSLFQKIGQPVRDNRVFVSPWFLFNVTEWGDWENLPHDMLSDWIHIMYDATRGL